MNERTPGATIGPISSSPRPSLALLAVGALALAAHAGTIVVKPGVRDAFAPEFSRTLARSSTHTVAASLQETVSKPGEVGFGNPFITQQGRVYVFNNQSDAPERVYQFPGNAHWFKQLGARVAISDNWLAFASMREGTDPTSPLPAAVYVVGKTNGQWTQCPTVGGLLDCTPSVGAFDAYPQMPILRFPLHRTMQWTDLSLAVSNNTLAIADHAAGKLWIYRYNTASQAWALEHQSPGDAISRLGKGLAIDGDHVAVSSTFSSNGYDAGPHPGIVSILKRSASGTWNTTASSEGHFSTGIFGARLAFNAGNLVVTGGTTSRILAFYRVNSNGQLSAPFVVPTSSTPNQLAISGNTLAVAMEDTIRTLVVYRRDLTGTGTTWKATSSMDGRVYAAQNFNIGGYPGADEIGLAGDNLSLGWRGFGLDAQNSLIGAFIRQKVSALDACKNVDNLVQNCSFDIPSSTAWSLLSWNGASASANYANGEMTSNISNAGSDFWHVQARTKVSLPSAATYTLKFRARSTGTRSIQVNLGHNGTQDNNWTSYARVNATLNSTMQEFSFDLVGIPADVNAVLDFNLGRAGTLPVILDGVSLIKKETTAAPLSCNGAGNLVQNCSFDIPTSTAWSLLSWNGASAWPNYANGEMTSNINNAGSDFWHIQARTKVSVASAGTYNLKFRARSTGTRTIVVNLGHDGTQDNNWASYGRVNATLTSNMQEYSFDLAAIPADANSVLDFNLGNAGTLPVTIDDVRLTLRP